jgi:UDP-N-acetylmuramate-alanine ligase
MKGVSSRLIFDALAPAKLRLGCHLAQQLDDVVDLALEMAQPGDLIMTIGAGSIYRMAPKLVSRLGAVGVPS